MAKGDAEDLRRSLRGALREFLGTFDAPTLLTLRGEVQVAERWLEAKHPKEAGVARPAFDAVSRYHAFTTEIEGFAKSRRSAETASLFDLGSVGILAAENILTADKITPMRLLMSGLSEGLMFLASRQYVAGGNEILLATYRTHAVAVQDELWALARDFREDGGLAAIRGARAAIDDLFRRLDDPAIPVGAKTAVLHQLYVLVALVRCAQLLEVLDAL